MQSTALVHASLKKKRVTCKEVLDWDNIVNQADFSWSFSLRYRENLFYTTEFV